MDNFLPEDLSARLKEIGEVELLVGIPSYNNARTIGHVVRAASAGLAKYFPNRKSIIINSDGGSKDATREVVLSADHDAESLLLVSHKVNPIQRISTPYHGIPGKGSAFRTIFAMAKRLNAKACVVVDSDLRSITPHWIELLAGPVLEREFDYISPYYLRHKYDGTITNGIIYPMTRALFGFTLFFYFLATFHYLLYLINQRESIGKVCLISTIAGFGFHTLTIIFEMVELGHVPITSMQESLVFFSWAIVLIFLFLEYRYKIKVMGAFIIPLAFLAILFSLSFPIVTAPIPEIFKSAWLGVHTTLAFLGDAAFAIAFGVGVMYLIQERQLKNKKPGAFYRRLPSLEVLDELNYKSIAIGFPLLTLAIVSGAIWANSVRGYYWSWDPKEIWSLITWLIYAAYLHARLVAGWRGRKAAYMAAGGFILVLFTFLGVHFLLPSWHDFDR